MSAPGAPTADTVENHPLVDDVNQMHAQALSPIERVCKRITEATGTPLALLLAVIVQFIWIAVGTATHWDPYPFAFLLTCSNILQLILIFIIAVAQRQQSLHDEIRADADHDAISRLLYHQQLQDGLLLQLAARAGLNVDEARKQVETLSAQAKV